MSAEPKLELVGLMVCDHCLDGKGSECHTSGCAYWMCDVPMGLRDRAIALHVTVPISPLDMAAWRHIEYAVARDQTRQKK